MGSILDKKIDLNDLKAFLAGPFTAIYDAFLNLFNLRNEISKEDIGTNIVYDVRRGIPIIIKSEKIMSQYEKVYGKIDSKFAMDAVQMGIKREICDEIMRSDLFEWSIDETAMGTRVAARIIVNKF